MRPKLDIKYIAMYRDEGKTTTEISELSGMSLSTVRKRLMDAGVLRTLKQASILAGKLGRKGNHLIGKPRHVSDAARQQMRISRKAWAERCATGVTIKPSGYAEVTMGINKFRGVHRVVMEAHLGRALLNSEVVHHIDGNKLNNSIENLQIMTPSDHARHHALNARRARTSLGRFK